MIIIFKRAFGIALQKIERESTLDYSQFFMFWFLCILLATDKPDHKIPTRVASCCSLTEKG